LSVKADARGADLRVDLPRRESIERLVVHLESFDRPVRRTLYGGKSLTADVQSVPTDNSLRLRLEFEK
jgi:hypothetical protein